MNRTLIEALKKVHAKCLADGAEDHARNTADQILFYGGTAADIESLTAPTSHDTSELVAPKPRAKKGN